MDNSQQFIPIEDIQQDIIFLKNGSASLVLTTAAVNFGLLFETEQISIIDSFAGFLNSLSFPIQVIIRSRRLDVSSYVEKINQAMSNQTNPQLKKMTAGYRSFVEKSIKDNNVLDKQFYVCINISAVELGFLHHTVADRSKKALTVLLPRRDHVMRQLSRLGLRSRQLNSEELIKLLYDIYNTEVAISYTYDPQLEQQPINEPVAKLPINNPHPQSPIAPPTPTPIESGPTVQTPPTKPVFNPAPAPIPNQPEQVKSESAPQSPVAPAVRPPVPPVVLTRTQPAYLSPTPIANRRMPPPFIVEELQDDFGP